MIVPKLEELNSGNIREVVIKKQYPEFYNFLLEKYNTIPHIERLYCYYNNINVRPVCLECGNKVKFLGIRRGYQKFCGVRCSNKNSEKLQKSLEKCDYNKISKKTRRTKLERYGDEHYNNSAKTKETMYERYGGQGNSSNLLKEKYRNTCLERYGVENPMQNEDIMKLQKSRIDTKSMARKIQKTRRDFEKNRQNHIIDYTDDKLWICKCPHANCNKCNEKQYIIHPSIYAGRKANNLEVCTILNPVNPKMLKNTYSEQFVKSILDEYSINYIENDRQILSGQELDIYIPSHNIAIECNGIYWHDNKHKPINYHANKFKKCLELGIQLVSIWEDQVWSIPNIIKSLVLSKLGIYDKRVYARKCTVMEVSSKDACEFIEKNHIQGKTNSSIRLGLYHNDELLSIMTFGKRNNEYELIRFCNKLHTQVIGGASKLFKYFIKQYKCDNIISYSSNDISTGSLYNNLGFKKINESISYWYVYNMTRYHRLNFTKSRLVAEGFDPSKSETQIMYDRGYLKIYDSGQQKWTYEKNIQEQPEV